MPEIGNFLKARIDSATETPVVEAVDPVVSDLVVETVTEATAEVVVSETPVIEEPVVIESPVVSVEAPQPEKLKIDYTEWLTNNEKELAEYLTQKNKDYSVLSDAEVLELKLKNDNTAWSNDDVKSELADKYGVGLSKIEIDTDEMSDQEVKDAIKHNAFIDRGQRLLKQEAKVAKDYFNDYKQNIKLPEFEYLIDQPSSKGQNETQLSPEDFQKNLTEQVQEFKNTKWIPQLEDAVKGVESLSHSIEVEDNGGKVALNIDYKLSDKEKQELVKHLSDYQGHPSDDKYVKEDGSSDLKAFMTDKAKEFYFDRVLKSAVKEALAISRKTVIKNDLLNHDDGVRANVPTDGGFKSELDEMRSILWGGKK